MKQVTDEGFIEIGGQVAMPEETVAELLDVSIEKLQELAKSVDMWNREGGMYSRDGKIYFASPDVIFKVRDANGKKSADLSRNGLFQVFAKAEARLMPEEAKKKNRRTWLKIGAVVLALFIFSQFSSGEKSTKTSSQPPSPPKVEQKAEQPAPAPVAQPAPAKVLDLGMTLDQFKAAYNATSAKVAPDAGWNLDNMQYKPGENKDSFMFVFSDNVVMVGTMDGATTKVREVLISSTPKNMVDSSMALAAFTVLSVTLNPDLTVEQRHELLVKLNLSNAEQIQRLTNGENKKVLVGNVIYTASFIPTNTMFNFGVRAKDI